MYTVYQYVYIRCESPKLILVLTLISKRYSVHCSSSEIFNVCVGVGGWGDIYRKGEDVLGTGGVYLILSVLIRQFGSASICSAL